MVNKITIVPLALLAGSCNGDTTPLPPQEISMSAALGGEFLYVEGVSKTVECNQTLPANVEWIMIEEIDGYFGAVENPTIVMEVLGIPRRYSQYREFPYRHLQ